MLLLVVSSKISLANFKSIAEILGYFSAALYFLFKVVSGIFYSAISLNLNCSSRHSFDLNNDIVVLNLEIIGGETAVIDLHEINGRISYGEEVNYFSFSGIERLQVIREDGNLKLTTPWMNYTGNKYRICIKERTLFSEVLYVQKNQSCKIEVIVVGTRKKFWKGNPAISQWRISQNSLPLKIDGDKL